MPAPDQVVEPQDFLKWGYIYGFRKEMEMMYVETTFVCGYIFIKCGFIISWNRWMSWLPCLQFLVPGSWKENLDFWLRYFINQTSSSVTRVKPVSENVPGLCFLASRMVTVRFSEWGLSWSKSPWPLIICRTFVIILIIAQGQNWVKMNSGPEICKMFTNNNTSNWRGVGRLLVKFKFTQR